jgi:hypothetical protein
VHAGFISVSMLFSVKAALRKGFFLFLAGAALSSAFAANCIVRIAFGPSSEAGATLG